MSANSEPATATGISIEVALSADLHARPAGQLSQLAAGFEAVVHLEFAGRSVRPVGILSVMALGARAGNILTVRAEGPDAEAAAREVALLLTEIE
jgi:phosphotransferase system HPr (HPr) family protein